MKIRAKFQLQQIIVRSFHPDYPNSQEFVFRPQYDPSIPEDQRFAKASPSGEFSICVDNQPVADYLRANLQKFFYFDFEVAED